MELFRKSKTRIIPKLHKTDLVIVDSCYLDLGYLE